ncbi:MAG: hypothetical protein U0V49_02305 [Saprospiraceae bacterium]
MKNNITAIALYCTLNFSALMAQDASPGFILGYHLGYVQPLISIEQGHTEWMTHQNNFTIGFPIGVGFRTGGKAIFDLEMVPLINPYYDETSPMKVHLLLHPGFLFPLGGHWTFGLRAAFEISEGQVGFTPLLNRSFALTKSMRGFTELVLPGRFTSGLNLRYTQVLGLHVGIGF